MTASKQGQSREAERDAIRKLGRGLAEAWRKYHELFAEVPHGNEKQMAALCEMLPNKAMWASAPTLAAECERLTKINGELAEPLRVLLDDPGSTVARAQAMLALAAHASLKGEL